MMMTQSFLMILQSLTVQIMMMVVEQILDGHSVRAIGTTEVNTGSINYSSVVCSESDSRAIDHRIFMYKTKTNTYWKTNLAITS